MTDKELQTKLDNEECDIVDNYTICFATYLMQKQRDEVDRLRAEKVIDKLLEEFTK